MRRDLGRSVQRNLILTAAHPIWLLTITIATASSGPAVLAGEAATKSADRSRVTAAALTAREGLRRGIAGDLDARSEALQSAIQADPSCQLAHWHRGEIQFDGRWVSVEQAAPKIARDLDFEEYDQLRDKMLKQPDGDLALADWCKQHGMPAAERLHLHRVLQNSTHAPTRNQAIRRLGLRNFQGVLLPPETIKALEQQAATHQQQLEKWTETVQVWAEGLTRGRARQREHIREQINDELDATVIPALTEVFSVHSESLALELITLLARLPQHEATVSLVRQSIVADWPSVRMDAAKQLAKRPMHDYVPLLLRQLASPIQTRYAVGIGPDGLVRHRHLFYREGATENYLIESLYVGGPIVATFLDYSPHNGLGGRNAIVEPIDTAERYGFRGDEARRYNARARQRRERLLARAAVARDLMAVEQTVRSVRMEQEVALANQQTAAANQVVFSALREATGEANLASTPESWWQWWQNYTETYLGEKPTYQYQSKKVDPFYIPIFHVTFTSCFPAGTQIRTLEGMKSIERVQAGDRVLSQDVESGELAYKLVLHTTERPPSDVLEIGLGDSTVTATKGHPFWVNGVGWRMAKQLQPGDQIHALSGGATVDRVESAAPAAAHNLVVADFHTYFVGSAQVLAHDNTYRKPTRALTPGFHRDTVPSRR
jgi:hypothetical protein